jgi:hypothetical protein
VSITLCDESDIKSRLQLGDTEDLTADQAKAWPPLAQEATGLVEGFLGRTWPDETLIADVPTAVRVVVSRMTVRAMTTPTGPGAPIDGQQSASSTFGPMSYARGFGSESVFTSPWMSKADRLALTPYLARQAVQNEPMYDTSIPRGGRTLGDDWGY